MNKESTQQPTPSNESIEQMAEEYVVKRYDGCIPDRIIPDYTEWQFHKNNEESFVAGYKAALVEMHQTAQGKEWVKERLNKEIEKIKDEFNSLNDQRSYSTGSYLQTKITTLKDVLKWLDEPRTP